MDTAFSTEDKKFQEEVRDFIKSSYPQELRDSINSKRKLGQELSRDDLTAWHKILGNIMAGRLLVGQSSTVGQS